MITHPSWSIIIHYAAPYWWIYYCSIYVYVFILYFSCVSICFTCFCMFLYYIFNIFIYILLISTCLPAYLYLPAGPRPFAGPGPSAGPGPTTTYLPAYLPTCLPAYLPTCLPACLPTCLPACLPTCLPTYLLFITIFIQFLIFVSPQIVLKMVSKA